MCVPLAPVLVGASLAIQVGSTIADHKAQARQSRAVRRAARRTERIDRQSISIRQIQEGIAASRRIRDLRLQAEERSGLIGASAAEAGVTGANVQQLEGGLAGSLGRAVVDVQDSYVATIDQLERQKLAVSAAAESRIAGAPGPSGLATGLRLGGAVTSALGQYQQIQLGRRAAGG